MLKVKEFQTTQTSVTRFAKILTLCQFSRINLVFGKFYSTGQLLFFCYKRPTKIENTFKQKYEKNFLLL